MTAMVALISLLLVSSAGAYANKVTQDETVIVQTQSSVSRHALTTIGAPGVANEIPQVKEAWHPTKGNLQKQYGNIFKSGNRNAASHLWSRFLLERSSQMSHDILLDMFSAFCAVSGSPVRPSSYNRYKVDLEGVDGTGTKHRGFVQHCCWPCHCDTKDLIRMDTRNVSTVDGERSYRFQVIGNPCDDEDLLSKPYPDAFGRGERTLKQEAPELVCKDGVLQGAPLSDHGYVIIGMFQDFPRDADGNVLPIPAHDKEQPGRMTQVGGISFQDDSEFPSMCQQREANGFDSGMGAIFRKVAEIAPISFIAPANPHPPNPANLLQTSQVSRHRSKSSAHFSWPERNITEFTSSGHPAACKGPTSTCMRIPLLAPDVL